MILLQILLGVLAVAVLVFMGCWHLSLQRAGRRHAEQIQGVLSQSSGHTETIRALEDRLAASEAALRKALAEPKPALAAPPPPAAAPTIAAAPTPAPEKRPDHSAWTVQRNLELVGAKLVHLACSHGGWKTQIQVPTETLIETTAQGMLTQGWNLGVHSAWLLSCQGCSACKPVRIDVSVPLSRREKRALAPFRGDHGSITWNDPKTLDAEHLALAHKHQAARHNLHTTPDPQEIVTSTVKGGWTRVVSLRDAQGVLRAFIVLSLHSRGVAFARLHAYDPDAGGSLGTAAIVATLHQLNIGRGGIRRRVLLTAPFVTRNSLI